MVRLDSLGVEVAGKSQVIEILTVGVAKAEAAVISSTFGRVLKMKVMRKGEVVGEAAGTLDRVHPVAVSVTRTSRASALRKGSLRGINRSESSGRHGQAHMDQTVQDIGRRGGREPGCTGLSTGPALRPDAVNEDFRLALISLN